MAEILLPSHVADRMIEERKQLDEQRRVRDRANTVERFRKELMAKCAAAKDNHERAAICCCTMLNVRWEVPPETWKAIGKIISDALLGENYPHKIKC